jgi:transposase
MIEKATESIFIEKDNNRGRPSKLNPKEKTLFLLIKEIFCLSNRKMSYLLSFFSLLKGTHVSYKSIERCYSDPLVKLTLHNIFVLMVRQGKIDNTDLAGDGTGYSLSIKKHYADEKDKNKSRRDYVYLFTLLDLETNMYVGYGYSRKSEKDAYFKALKILKELGVDVNSVRMDRYYSNEKTVKEFEDASVYLIPKKNVTVKGSVKWKRMLEEFVSNTYEYLGEYFKRNRVESMFSSDKRLFGGYVRQKLDERIGCCLLVRVVLHNLFWMV